MFKKFNKIYHFIDEFKESDLSKLNSKISIIYRNYTKKIKIDHIIQIKEFCKKTERKFYLANNFKLAYKLKLDGAYIPSFNKSMKHNCYNKRLSFKILGSAHNIQEINIKEKQNVDYIFISPLFKTHKTKKFLGVYKFLELKKFSKKKIIALGGINKKNLKQLNKLQCFGLAAISFIKDEYYINEY